MGFFDDYHKKDSRGSDGEEYNPNLISERDKRELDENLTHSKRDRKRDNFGGYDNYGETNFGGGKRSWRDRFRSRGGNEYRNSGSEERRGFFSSLMLTIVGIAVLIGLISFTTGGLLGFWDMKDSTSEEHLGNFMQSLRNFNKESMRVRKNELYGTDIKADKVYDVNNIFDDEYIDKKQEKTYVVFAYTGDKEKDKDFAKWVLENESKYKIYRVLQSEIKTNVEARSYIYNATEKPLIYVYNEPVKNGKILDSVIDDSELLKELPKHLEELKANRKRTVEEVNSSENN